MIVEILQELIKLVWWDENYPITNKDLVFWGYDNGLIFMDEISTLLVEECGYTKE